MRKLLNSLYITDETVWLALDGENIVCKNDEGEKFRMPFVNIEEIFCFLISWVFTCIDGEMCGFGYFIKLYIAAGRVSGTRSGKDKGKYIFKKSTV